MDERKPHWMEDHERSDKENFDDIRQSLQRIEIKLDPIFDNYVTASRVAKWGTGLLMFLSVLLGVILSLKALLTR